MPPHFAVRSACSTSRARLARLALTADVDLPAFMPVATYAAMRAAPLRSVGSSLILANTWHCRALGPLRALTRWPKALLTDSGGFQIGSIPNAVVTEDGVVFPRDARDSAAQPRRVFTPEQSIRVQNTLGADIIMQLDDVVPPGSPRAEEAMHRSLRWLARCAEAHATTQLLFPIVQGGIDLRLRDESIAGIFARDFPGIAIGGLCGGEAKEDFCRVVLHCTRAIAARCGTSPKPIYVMGVGYPEDVVVCVALGCDMMDCVFPTRTARFGRMLADDGDINVSRLADVAARAPGHACACSTCTRHSLRYLHEIRNTTNCCMLLTAHNLRYMADLGARMRAAIAEDRFPAFAADYLFRRFRSQPPQWAVQALAWVGIAVPAESAA